MKVQPYLMFNGRTDEALAFYRKAVGAEVLMLMRFKEAPDQPPPGMVPPGYDDKVMHSCFRIGETELMASDGCAAGPAAFQGVSLSLTAATPAEAERLFDALADGGQVSMPMGKTFFSPAFGAVTDRFGVSWMVVVPQEMQASAAA
jgi:PhnB protein